MDNKIKHLEMIQSNISRMAQNSFTLKGWSLTLVIALFAFVPKQNAWVFIPIAIVPIIIFALLDAYYLQLERRYRKLYDIVRKKDENEIDFDMKITEYCKDKSNSLLKCLFSKSICTYYFLILLLSVGIIIALFI